MKQAACILFFLAAAARAQQPTPRGFGELFNQAPPHVDQALHERVQSFFQLQVEKKWRQADQFVHEDSKDAFFADDKLTARGFKIVGITYEENFTRARVVLDIDTDFFFPGFGQMQINRPLVSAWKFDKDQWWWQTIPFDPNVGKEGPFGPMFVGVKEGTAGQQPQGVIGGRMSLEDFKKALADLQSKVTVDKNEVVFPSHEPAEAEIVVSNQWEQSVHLTIDVPELSGLTLKIDKPILEAGQKARVKIVSKPDTRGAKPSLRARLTVEEISKVIPIDITYLPPPNTEPKPGTRIGPAPPQKQ